MISLHYPDDWALDYTSPRAGAHWRSQGLATFDRRADEVTYKHWLQLLSSGEKNTGLEPVPSYYYWEDDTEETKDDFAALWWKDLVGDFKILPQEELPKGSKFGVKYTTFAINPTGYMKYVLGKCEALGVRLVRKHCVGLEEVWKVPDCEDVAAVVNCTGMGARELVKDENVYPIKGQTVLVRGESDAVRFRKTKSGWQDAVIRRPGEGTILGVSKDRGDWSDNVDKDLTMMILERMKELAPELLVNGQFEVLRAQIGRRPARKGGVRIEAERLQLDGKERLVCHHYGHGGTG
jgi:D-amino-acid oxidase